MNINKILRNVQKPARYVGGEWGQIIKNKADISVRFALCFPDVYEIGMSNLGMRILYDCFNNISDVWCERAFAPWGDMSAELTKNNIPLFALESGDPLKDFDILGFSLGYEMSYTGVLNMLSLAQIPLKSSDRNSLTPLIVAGGSCCVNPEPMADFIDLFVIGEGEEAGAELIALFKTAKTEKWDKRKFLSRAAKIQGIYVPSLYEPAYGAEGGLLSLNPINGAPEFITKRIIENFNGSEFPTNPIVPSTEIVHDRVTLELFRGCIRGCRFCQAGYIYRPVRSRATEKCLEQGIDSLKNTGYQEISLSSLSSSDYTPLAELCDGLLDYCEPNGKSLSLPSLRADNFSIGLAQKIQKVRKSGLTFAPEAGSQRLRDVINKNVREEDFLTSCRAAFEGGYNSLKLYFMLGLPTETDEDVLAIGDLANRVLNTWKKFASAKNRGVRLTVSTSCFVPKPHTSFQWEGQISRDEYFRRVKLLREHMTSKAITYNWHDPETGFIEAALSRGDRRLGRVILDVHLDGGMLDSWSEYFSFSRWISAFEKNNLDPKYFASREREKTECLPWSRVCVGVSTEFLWSERRAAYGEKLSPDCRTACLACGANFLISGGICEENIYHV